MLARILATLCIAVGLSISGSARSHDEPPPKRPADKGPVALERAELDKRIAKVAYETCVAGSKLWESGDDIAYEGTFRLYEGTLKALHPLLDHRPVLARLVKDRLEKAAEQNAKKGAFLLREALDAVQAETAAALAVPKTTLWERLGGQKAVKVIVHDFAEAAMKDPKVNFTRDGKFKLDDKATARMEQMLVELISLMAGGPLPYSGERDLKAAHKGMKITDAEFDAVVAHFAAALKKHKVAQADIDELLKLVGSARPLIVGQ